MNAGRDLDRLIHDRVMGNYRKQVAAYSTDLAAAWLVLAEMRKIYSEVEVRETQMRLDLPPHTTVVICGHDEIVADTTPLAICLAALEATR